MTNEVQQNLCDDCRRPLDSDDVLTGQCWRCADNEAMVEARGSGPAETAAQHTPGPWSHGWTSNPEGDPILTVDDADNITVAIVYSERDEADARLIAAAPVLLEALDNLVGDGAQHETTCDLAEHDDDGPCIYCSARAAIAQARGEA